MALNFVEINYYWLFFHANNFGKGKFVTLLKES